MVQKRLKLDHFGTSRGDQRCLTPALVIVGICRNVFLSKSRLYESKEQENNDQMAYPGDIPTSKLTFLGHTDRRYLMGNPSRMLRTLSDLQQPMLFPLTTSIFLTQSSQALF